MKCDSKGYAGFGEAYFSTVESGAVKAWKRHRQMVLNLIVPIGSIRFVIYDTRKNSTSCDVFQEFILSKENYYRLTVPSMLWVGFQGVDEGASIVLNIANILHNPHEVERKELFEIKYDWGGIK